MSKDNKIVKWQGFGEDGRVLCESTGSAAKRRTDSSAALSHALMRASLAEANAKLLEAENVRLREELDRVVAML